MPESNSYPSAHNLVSLLYALKGTLESHLERTALLNNGPRGKRKSKTTDHTLRKAYVQADRAIQIVKRLNHLSSYEGQNPVCLIPSKVSVKKVWQNVLGLLQKEFSFDSFGSLERIPENFPSIHCDRKDFQEILYHLAKNAVQAMAEERELDRRILIIRGQVTFSQKEEPFAIIALSDTGPGIPGEKLSQFFHPFFTTKPEGEGNGLGLYLTRELVTKNKGKITASSFEGYGTTFTLEFPLAGHLSNKPLTAH